MAVVGGAMLVVMGGRERQLEDLGFLFFILSPYYCHCVNLFFWGSKLWMSLFLFSFSFSFDGWRGMIFLFSFIFWVHFCFVFLCLEREKIGENLREKER